MSGSIIYDSGVVVNSTSNLPLRTVIIEVLGLTGGSGATTQLVNLPADLQSTKQIISQTLLPLFLSGGNYYTASNNAATTDGALTIYNGAASSVAANHQAIYVGANFYSSGTVGARLTTVYCPELNVLT